MEDKFLSEGHSRLWDMTLMWPLPHIWGCHQTRVDIFPARGHMQTLATWPGSCVSHSGLSEASRPSLSQVLQEQDPPEHPPASAFTPLHTAQPLKTVLSPLCVSSEQAGATSQKIRPRNAFPPGKQKSDCLLSGWPLTPGGTTRKCSRADQTRAR